MTDLGLNILEKRYDILSFKVTIWSGSDPVPVMRLRGSIRELKSLTSASSTKSALRNYCGV